METFRTDVESNRTVVTADQAILHAPPIKHVWIPQAVVAITVFASVVWLVSRMADIQTKQAHANAKWVEMMEAWKQDTQANSRLLTAVIENAHMINRDDFQKFLDLNPELRSPWEGEL